jgi:hypothetical protein
MKRERAAPYIDLLILDELARCGPQTLAQLQIAIGKSDRLQPEDKVANRKRPNEPKWHSDLSNRLQPSRAGSLSRNGHTRNVGRGEYEITAQGNIYRQNEHEENANFEKMLSNLNIDFSL